MASSKSSYAPLSGGDRIKLVLYFLIMASTIFFGILPILIAISGLYIMKKDKNFSPIKSAKKFITGYVVLLAIGTSVLITAGYYDGNEYSYDYTGSNFKIIYNKDIKKETMMVAGATVIATPIVIMIIMGIINMLFYRPLESHKDWIAQNGVFSDTEERDTQTTTGIMGRDKLSSFSIADEMIKWNDLLEKNLITQDEFDAAKKKLLNQN